MNCELGQLYLRSLLRVCISYLVCWCQLYSLNSGIRCRNEKSVLDEKLHHKISNAKLNPPACRNRPRPVHAGFQSQECCSPILMTSASMAAADPIDILLRKKNYLRFNEVSFVFVVPRSVCPAQIPFMCWHSYQKKSLLLTSAQSSPAGLIQSPGNRQ